MPNTLSNHFDSYPDKMGRLEYKLISQHTVYKLQFKFVCFVLNAPLKSELQVKIIGTNCNLALKKIFVG